MIALRASIRRPVVAGSSSTQPFAPSRSGGRRPACEWGAVVVQPNCAVRISRLGDVSDRAPADQRTADGRRRESAAPSRTARSAPTRRTDRSNQRAALHQAAQRFCRIRLLKLAFRGLRSTAALAPTPTTANAASASSRRTATTTSEPMHDSAETLQAGASGVEAGSTCSTRGMEGWKQPRPGNARSVRSTAHRRRTAPAAVAERAVGDWM